MALADWPPRRIGYLWAAALLLPASFILLLRMQAPGPGYNANPTPPDSMTPERQLSPDSAEVIRYAFLTRSYNPLTGRQDSARDRELATMLKERDPARRDSMWTALGLPGRLTQAQRDSADTALGMMIQPLKEALNDMGKAFMMAAIVGSAVLASPLLVALVITILWWHSRRRPTKAVP